VITSQTCINILISSEDVGSCREITAKMKLPEVENTEYITDVSLIAAVGSGLLEKEGISAEIFSSLSRERINVEMIATGASEVTMYFIIDRRDRERALQVIQGELFGAEL
jgi:aspartate kinase/aspartokinase/homoserine dehydrogenase 1